MAARTKGRAKFDFHGRPFVWWVDHDYWLRVISLDKKFVVALALGTELADPPKVAVIGSEFPGLSPKAKRPIWLVGPPYHGPAMGTWVHNLLTWAFDTKHQLQVCSPPQFIGGTAGVE